MTLPCRTPLLFAALAIVGALLFAGAALAQKDRAPAGYVTSVDAPARDGKPTAILRREGQEVDLQIWTSLFDGDVIEVSEGAVTIETTKDKRLVVDAARSPHRVEGELPTAGRFSAVASVIGDLFRQKPSRNAAALIGRTGAPEIRIGGQAAQSAVAGAPVWASWVGGSPPFTVEILGRSPKGSRDVVSLVSEATGEHAALLNIPAAASGKLTLVVRDAMGREARRPLAIVRAPAYPAWIGAAPTPEFAQVARALHLLADRTRRMELLAATAAAQAGDYPPAVNLRAMLTEGRRPE